MKNYTCPTNLLQTCNQATGMPEIIIKLTIMDTNVHRTILKLQINLVCLVAVLQFESLIHIFNIFFSNTALYGIQIQNFIVKFH
jgi:hypothetical protein